MSVTLVLIEITWEAVLMPHLWLTLHTRVCWPGRSPLKAVDPSHLVTGVTQGCHHGPTWSQGQAGLPVSGTYPSYEGDAGGYRVYTAVITVRQTVRSPP